MVGWKKGSSSELKLYVNSNIFIQFIVKTSKTDKNLKIQKIKQEPQNIYSNWYTKITFATKFLQDDFFITVNVIFLYKNDQILWKV